ncbi:MAG: RnfABCDGE type electron transport complex subunit G [Chlorobi bacterium]|nr:RnfABCDGE type electron transport complex subunit G [Chlorobiota bacterium]
MAKQRESTFVNMVVVLFIVSVIAATALALVYKATKGPIAKSKLEKKKKAIKNVVNDFDNNPIAEMFKIPVAGGDSVECYPAKKDGKIVGYAIKTFSKKGFGGLITLMIGFDPDGHIHKTAVLEQHETPGLGDKMQRNKSTFSNQFDNMDVPNIPDKDHDGIIIEVTKDHGTVDAITAATISSRAFCDAAERAYNAFKKIKK